MTFQDKQKQWLLGSAKNILNSASSDLKQKIYCVCSSLPNTIKMCLLKTSPTKPFLCLIKPVPIHVPTLLMRFLRTSGLQLGLLCGHFLVHAGGKHGVATHSCNLSLHLPILNQVQQEPICWCGTSSCCGMQMNPEYHYLLHR
jgi:hypothetical protein